MKTKNGYVGAMTSIGNVAYIKIDDIQSLEVRGVEVIATVNNREFIIGNTKIGTSKKLIDYITLLGLEVLE